MVREPTRSERALRAVAVTVLIAWYLAVLVLALGFVGPRPLVTWAGRLGLLAAGTLATAWLARLAVRAWRRALARPLPPGPGSRWLARQPGWRLAAGCWSLYAAPEFSTRLWLRPRGHPPVATGWHIAGLVISVLGACVVALGCRVLWQRQAENSRRARGPVSP